MPTIMTHAVVPLAVGLCVRAVYGPQVMPTRLIVLGMLFAILPDADVIGFKFGVGYGTTWGHRGATHSLSFAAACSVLLLIPWLRAHAHWSWAVVFGFIAMASHGLLDALTDGGLGPALLWPSSDERFFAAVRPIEVSPIGIARFLSPRGWDVMKSELFVVWLPAIVVVISTWVSAWLWRGWRQTQRS